MILLNKASLDSPPEHLRASLESSFLLDDVRRTKGSWFYSPVAPFSAARSLLLTYEPSKEG